MAVNGAYGEKYTNGVDRKHFNYKHATNDVNLFNKLSNLPQCIAFNNSIGVIIACQCVTVWRTKRMR